MTSGENLDQNLAVCASLAEEAASKGAKMLVLPECFAFLGLREADKFAVAEVVGGAHPGPIVSYLADLARRHRLFLIGGGMPEKKPGEGQLAKVFNTAVAISPDGELIATYRKIHLFDVDIPGGATLRESDSTYGGKEAEVIETPLGNVGLTICYDLRFPELYRKLVSVGADLFVVPSAFTAHTGAAHWHVLLRARAIENQCYLVAAAQGGRHNEKRESYGHSMIVDPWGDILDEIAEGTGLAVAEVDLDKVVKTRQQMPCLQHRVIE